MALENPEENLGFANVGEIIQRLEQVIPEEIRARYFGGDIWNEILQQRQCSPDDLAKSRIIQKPTSLVKYLAAYLINVVTQSLFQELALDMKVDPNSNQCTALSPQEIEIIETAIRTIVEFVKNQLAIPVRIDPEINQPHVLF